MIFCLSTLLTSCDEIFGEGDNPVPVIPPSPVVDEAKVLGAALEAGAIVSVTYNVGSTTYVATFVKNSDDSYTLQSNAKISAARALTRGVSDPTVTVGDGATVGDQVQLLLSGNKLKLVAKQYHFYRQYLKHGVLTACVNTVRWGVSGIRKFS